MHSPINELKLPRILTETPSERGNSVSPVRGMTELKNYTNFTRRSLRRQKKNQSLLDEHLSNKFFVEESHGISKILNVSPKLGKTYASYNSVWRRELEKAGEKLVDCELNLKKIADSEESLQKLEMEYRVYMEYLDRVVKCCAFVHSEIYKAGSKAVYHVGQVFSKVLVRVAAENKKKSEGEIKFEKKSRVSSEKCCQTEEKQREDIEIEMLKELSEKFKLINMPKVTRGLEKIYKSMIKMRASVPNTPESPKINSENIIKLLHSLKKSDKNPITTFEKSSQAGDPPQKPKLIQSTSYKQPETDFSILQRKQELEKLSPSGKLKEFEFAMNKDNEKQIEKLEIELISLRSMCKHLEDECLKSKNSIKETVSKVEKGKKGDAKELESAKKELKTMKKEFMEELHQQEILLNITNAKLIDIESAWMKRTGTKFIYNSTVAEFPQSLQINSKFSKPVIDFDSKKDLKKPNVSVKQQKDFRLNNPQEYSKVDSKSNSQKTDSLNTIPIKPENQSFVESISPQKVFSKPPKGQKIKEKKATDFQISSITSYMAHKDTEESYQSAESLEQKKNSYEDGEEELFKALAAYQWDLFIKYKIYLKKNKFAQLQTNLEKNSKSCLTINCEEENNLHVGSKIFEVQTKSAEFIVNEKISIESELENIMENPNIKILVSKAFQFEKISGPDQMKLKLISLFKDHLNKRCGENCEHLRRAMQLGYKYMGKAYPIKKLNII